MPLFTAASLRESARIAKLANFSVRASELLEASGHVRNDQTFDVFLSHSYLDADLVLGLKEQIEQMGYSVYVDWVTDSELERGSSASTL